MKFTCEKTQLVSAISVASRTVAQKSAITGLEGILVRAGVKVMLTGYNLETGITVSVDADVQENGACIMPARLFFDIVRKLPDDTVSIQVDENFKVSIKGGISSFTITPERMEAVDFVSMFKAGSTWVVKKGNPNKIDTSDLCGKKVAVQTATMQETEANKIAKQCEADGKDKLEVISSKLQTDVTTNVVTGKADVFYADSPVAGYAIAQTDGQLEMLGKVEGVAPEGIVIKKGDSQMDEAVQKAVQKLIDDGTYLKILKYWGVEDGAIETSEINTPGAE